MVRPVTLGVCCDVWNPLHSHTALREGHSASTTRGHEAGLSRSIEDRRLHELLGYTGGGGSLLHAELVTGLDAGLELALPDILALGKSDIERLVVEHALVYLGSGLGGVVGVAEAVDGLDSPALSSYSPCSRSLASVRPSRRYGQRDTVPGSAVWCCPISEASTG
jgi:hypothetical protein